VALSKYAKARGLAIREVYDAIACLRRKGLLPRTDEEGEEQVRGSPDGCRRAR